MPALPYMARLGCLTAGCDFRLWPKLAGAADTLGQIHNIPSDMGTKG